MGKNTLKIDKKPTAEEEAASFDIKKEEHDYDLKKTKQLQGFFGRLTGSNDPGINFAVIVVCILGIITIAIFGGYFYREELLDTLQTCIASIIAVVSYVFGRTSK